MIADADAADAIVDAAERRDADLVIMGTHDRNRLLRAVLGSVTDSVLRETNRPVLILREHNDAAHEDPIRKILCPFRDAPASAAAVGNAAALAAAFGAELQLVQLLQDGNPGEAPPDWLAKMVSPEAVASLGRMQIGEGAGKRLVKLADEIGADLIVLGTSHRRFSDSGSAAAPAAYVVRAAHCPVLSVTASAS